MKNVNGDRYLYNVGDRVFHSHHPDVEGTVVKLLTMDDESGDPLDQEDPTNPFYHIQWDGWDEGVYGFESELMILPHYTNKSPIKVIQFLHDEHHELWVELCKRAR